MPNFIIFTNKFNKLVSLYVLDVFCLDVILPTPKKRSQKQPGEKYAIFYHHISKIYSTMIL